MNPIYGGKGHGNRLVLWGIEQSKKEGVAVSLVSAYEKDTFYAKFGFVKSGMANLGPMDGHGLRGGTIMFIDI